MIHEIAQRILQLDFNDLSELARERAGLCLLANIAVAVAGVRYCRLPPPDVPGGRYPVFSGTAAADPRTAAFYNAAVMHARTQDDFDPVGNLHAGTVIVPALLALSEDVQLSGKRFMEAIAVGYMVAAGISRFLSPQTTPRGIRSTGYYAPFGATAAVSKALGLNLEETANALALTTVFTGGTTQAWIDGSDEWQLHAANAAEAGLKATALAQAGLHGGTHALDGIAGFYAALTGAPTPFDRVADDFDASRAIEESVIKRFPVSGICQSVVLASLRVREQLATTEQIKQIRIEMNAFERSYPGTLNSGPGLDTFGKRLMSAPFCACAVLSSGELSLADFQSGTDRERDRLMASTDVIAGPDRNLLSARVSVKLNDGSVLSGETLNSRDEIQLDWDSIRDWGAALWVEAGRKAEGFDSCLATVKALPDVSRVRFRPVSDSIFN